MQRSDLELVTDRFLRAEEDQGPPVGWEVVEVGEPYIFALTPWFDGESFTCVPIRRGDLTLTVRNGDVRAYSGLTAEPYDVGDTNPGEDWDQMAGTVIGTLPGAIPTIWPTRHAARFILGTTIDDPIDPMVTTRECYIATITEGSLDILETLDHGGQWVFFDAELTVGAFLEDQGQPNADPRPGVVVRGVSGRTLGASSAPIDGELVGITGNRIWLRTGESTLTIVDPLDGSTELVDIEQVDEPVAYDVGSQGWAYHFTPDDDGMIGWAVFNVSGLTPGFPDTLHRDLRVRRIRIDPDGTTASPVLHESLGFDWEAPQARDHLILFDVASLHCVDGYALSISDVDATGLEIS